MRCPPEKEKARLSKGGTSWLISQPKGRFDIKFPGGGTLGRARGQENEEQIERNGGDLFSPRADRYRYRSEYRV